VFIHLLSKELRRKLIALVVKKSGSAEAASLILGVSRTSVYKFLSGMTPSDRVTGRAIEYLRSRGGSEWHEAVHMITGELKRGLEDFASYAGLTVSCKVYTTISDLYGSVAGVIQR
jgi:hypothetical protein